MLEITLKIDATEVETVLRRFFQQEISNAVESIAKGAMREASCDRRLLNTKEVCAYLQISRGTLIKLVKDEIILSKKVGNKRLFMQASIENYLKSKTN